MNRAHVYVIHCDYVTVLHVTSAFKCVDCETCIHLHNYLFCLGKSNGSDFYILELYINCLYVV